MQNYQPQNMDLSKYLFFTGKGGVGKTSSACATAVTLADAGSKVLLISTDPASNLQDVFSIPLSNKGTALEAVPNLIVANLDPLEAAREYKESVIAPYRGLLPEDVLQNMEEQLSGSCTVEIAAFNEFSKFITDEEIQNTYDYILFDTAPTGHTLRMLQLPSAWNSFIQDSTHGASCLGQLSGLDDKKEIYKQAVNTLASSEQTTLILVTRPEKAPLKEAARASQELADLGIRNQLLIVNGLLDDYDDSVSESLYQKQRSALMQIPEILKSVPNYLIPLRAYNISGMENIRDLLTTDKIIQNPTPESNSSLKGLQAVIDDLDRSNKRVIFTMGKGGVGKTTVAAAIAMGLVTKGKKVHLTTTDPAAHLAFVLHAQDGITLSQIDEDQELMKYRQEILRKARENHLSDADIAYIEEDLRSPCTQEIAIFRAFADIVEKAENEVVVIDTAPTGHTLLLLDSTQSYNKEIQRSAGEVPESARKLLPRLRNQNETEVLIVTLPEPTPYYEAQRLEEDLQRAQIATKWWVVNSSMVQTGTTNPMLAAKASHEVEWINKIDQHSHGNFVLIPWCPDEVEGDKLKNLMP